jgi:hypothetical protein
MVQGNTEDKTHFRERVKLISEATRLYERASEETALGNVTKAREFTDMANSFKREAQDDARNYQYSFEQEGKKADLTYGKEKLEEIMNTWGPEQIKENLPYVESLAQGWRDMSGEEFSFYVDKPTYQGQEGSGKLVRVSHPGVPANQIEGRLGTSEPTKILDHYGYAAGGLERGEESTEQKPDEPEKTNDLETMPQKDFDKEMERRTGRPF